MKEEEEASREHVSIAVLLTKLYNANTAQHQQHHIRRRDYSDDTAPLKIRDQGKAACGEKGHVNEKGKKDA